MFKYIKVLLVRIKNSGYRLSETKLEQQRLVLKLNTKPKYLLCPHCFQEVALCHFQSSEQRQGQETTRKEHVQCQVCEGFRETKE